MSMDVQEAFEANSIAAEQRYMRSLHVQVCPPLPNFDSFALHSKISGPGAVDYHKNTCKPLCRHLSVMRVHWHKIDNGQKCLGIFTASVCTWLSHAIMKLHVNDDDDHDIDD